MNNESVVFAKNLNIKDFEDALQSAMAIQSGCDCIVTRNVADYKKVFGIEVLTPKDFLSKFV
jgi:predicted nucleic acid-binding protein